MPLFFNGRQQCALVRYLDGMGKMEPKRECGRELIGICRPFASLGMMGVAATQINSASDALFARAADPEGPAYLWYAVRIQQLPF